MIDFFDAEFAFPLDSNACRQLSGHNRSTRPRRFLRRSISAPGWMGKQSVIVGPDTIRVQICPAKVLGSWNSYGTNDLQEVARLTAPLVLQQMGHTLTTQQEAMIERGEYRLREVHVAESFHLANFSQAEFIRLLAFSLGPLMRPQWARRGTGFVINPQNRRVSAYLYAKVEEFVARALPKYGERMSSEKKVRRMWTALSRNAHLAAAALGPRLEFRFGDQFFRNKPLERGRAWKVDTASKLYLSELKRLELPESIAPMWSRDEAKRVLSAAEFQTLCLWHHGERVQSLGSASTFKRHRAAIREALRIDIAHPSGKALGVRQTVAVREVFSPDNMIGLDFDLDDSDSQEMVHRVLSLA